MASLKFRKAWRRRSASHGEHDMVDSLFSPSFAQQGRLSEGGQRGLLVEQKSMEDLNASGDSLFLPTRRKRLNSISCSADAVYTLGPTTILVPRAALPVDSRRDSLTVGTVGSSHEALVSLSGIPSLSPDTSQSQPLHTIVVDDPELGFVQLLKAHPCYNAVPNNGKLVVFDTDLPVKKAFYGLIWNCARAALLWERDSIVGILSVTDFIRVLLMFRDRNHVEGGAQKIERALDEHEIKSWRRLLSERKALKPLIKIYADESLFRAAHILTSKDIHRLPVFCRETGNPLYILTYKRILKFLWIMGDRLPRPDYMERSPRELGIGRWVPEVLTVSPETPLIECLRVFLSHNISGLPIVNKQGKLVDMYTRFDAIGIAARGTFDKLEVPVEEALSNRKDSPDFEGVVRCHEEEPMMAVVGRLVEKEVHRIAIVDKLDRLVGLITMSDIIRYIVLRPLGHSLAKPSVSSSFLQESGGEEMMMIVEQEESEAPPAFPPSASASSAFPGEAASSKSGASLESGSSRVVTSF